MTYFIAGNTAVENARAVAQSALPNAPVEEYHEPAPRRSYAVRARLGAVLRAAAAQRTQAGRPNRPAAPLRNRR